MRAIIQRVSSASVSVEGEVISEIAKGLLVLVGIAQDDTLEDAKNISRKILNQRVFDDGIGMWKLSVKDIDGDILCIPQFTLYGNTTKGNKPDFHSAMASSSSKGFYQEFLNLLRTSYAPSKVKDGKFGAMMSIKLCNEGPVTLCLDSRKFTYNGELQDTVPKESVGNVPLT